MVNPSIKEGEKRRERFVKVCAESLSFFLITYINTLEMNK